VRSCFLTSLWFLLGFSLATSPFSLPPTELFLTGALVLPVLFCTLVFERSEKIGLEGQLTGRLLWGR